MTSYRIFYTHFTPRHNSFLSVCKRHFCSKDSGVTSEGSNLGDNSSNKKSNEETEQTPSVKRKDLQFKPTPLTEETKEAARQKLKSLLSDITITSERTSKSSLNFAKAVKRTTKKERVAQIEAAKITPEKEIDTAVKAVASTFNEDSEKVESELKEKLTSLNLAQKHSTEEDESAQDISQIDNKVNENLMSSVDEVAATISEHPIPPRSELAQRLMRISLDQKVPPDEKRSMRSVIEGLVIQKKQAAKTVTERPTKISERKIPQPKYPSLKRIEHVNLFGAAPLNIFDPSTEVKPESTNRLWQQLEAKEVRLLTQFAPANAFEEMILWTEQGKHWKFPINNEIEMGEEEKVGFHEHVFLEKHLKGFPMKGPIRHFMELVCVGLSKNPYITVERKVENIEWFRSYFKDKETLLRECGALD